MKAQVLEFLNQEKQKVEAIISDIRGRIEYDAAETVRTLDLNPRNIINYKFVNDNLNELLADGWQLCDDGDMVQKTVIESPEAITQRQRILPHRLAYTAALHRWYRIAHGKLNRIEKCIEWLKMSTQ